MDRSIWQADESFIDKARDDLTDDSAVHFTVAFVEELFTNGFTEDRSCSARPSRRPASRLTPVELFQFSAFIAPIDGLTDILADHLVRV